MIKLNLAVLTLITTTAFAATTLKHESKSALNIVYKEKNVQIEIPQEAFTALNKWNSEFKIFDRNDFSKSILELFEEPAAQPMAFIGDFEGNGKKGIALFGQDTKTQYVVALIPEGKAWKAIEISTSDIPDIKKSEVPTTDESKEVGIPYYILPAEGKHAQQLKKKTGIQVEAYLGAAEVFQIIKGKAVKFVIK